MWRVPTWAYALLFVVLLIGNIYIYQELFTPPALIAAVIEEGKSPVVLIGTPSGQFVLVNTGADAGVLRSLGAALPLFRRRFAAVVITKAHRDAMGGLMAVSERYRINTFVRAKEEGTPSVERLIADATAGMRVLTVSRGDRLILDGVTLDVLSDAPIALRVSRAATAYEVDDQGVTVVK